jgi:hypothetical protein
MVQKATASPGQTVLSVSRVAEMGPHATVTVKLHELELPTLSNTLQVTVVTPIGNVLPEFGEQLKLAIPHASEALAM